MIIDTNKKYRMQDIVDFMSDIVASRLSNGYKIDFEQQFYIRNCTYLEDEIGETYMVTTGETVSILTYLEGDFNDYTQDIFISDRMFEAGTIGDDTFKNELGKKVAEFKSNQDGTYSLKKLRFNI